jgi:hypothetical protein
VDRVAPLVVRSLLATLAAARLLAPDAACAASDPGLERIAAQNRAYIAARQLGDGALPYSHDAINPYFGNLAVDGLLAWPREGMVARRWFDWYIAHLNHGDANRWHLDATIYVYDVKGGGEIATGNASNVDANPATFASALLAYYRQADGDAAARAFVARSKPVLLALGRVMDAVLDHDLTWDKPDYRVKYLIDNCEVYGGYRDLARLFALLGNADTSAAFDARADAVRGAINTQLWNEADRSYFYDITEKGGADPVDWQQWYRDHGAVSQLFPIIYGVIAPTDPRAIDLYRRFNDAFPHWADLDKPDEFAWTSVSYAAALMGDSARARRYLDAVDQRIGASGYRWPWHIQESGWLLKAAAVLAR